MRRTSKELVIIYVAWLVVWYLILNYFKAYLPNLTNLFLIIVVGLIIKDIWDISKKKDPWPIPKYWDHALFSVMVAFFFYSINPLVSIIAGIDAVLDIYDDISKLRR